MSRNRVDKGSTGFWTKTEISQEHKRKIRDAATTMKNNAIEEANKPLGLCLIIAVFMLVLFIAPPIAIVLL